MKRVKSLIQVGQKSRPRNPMLFYSSLQVLGSLTKQDLRPAKPFVPLKTEIATNLTGLTVYRKMNFIKDNEQTLYL